MRRSVRDFGSTTTMEQDKQPFERIGLETDERFPSGPWTGFYLQKLRPGRHWMELRLTFARSILLGDGLDSVGAFHISGKYDVKDGSCHWTKLYVARHAVSYRGFSEGKGIWGVWTIRANDRGGFHIWPLGMEDPTLEREFETAEMPVTEVATVVSVAP